MKATAPLILGLAVLMSFGAMCETKKGPLCPNGACDHGSGETLRNCPQDCAALCGNRRCDLGIENADSCPDDCGCGNGRCEGTETPNNCKDDCPLGCGDQVCATWIDENIVNCPLDCHGHCGDGTCDWRDGESFESSVCQEDCRGGECESGIILVNFCENSCGDGICQCELGENQVRCPGDCDGSEACSGPPDRCGNGACEATFDETPIRCPADCACGDNECDLESETPQNCGQDCKCGDDVCATALPYGETRFNCPEDCSCEDGACAGSDPRTCPADCYCGDRVCEPRSEDPESCPADCKCGDGICQAPENHASCSHDCKCGNGRCGSDETVASCPADCATVSLPDAGSDAATMADAGLDAAVPCGAASEPCCSGATGACHSGLVCQGSLSMTCVPQDPPDAATLPCGAYGDMCCGAVPYCGAGLTCYPPAALGLPTRCAP